MHIEQLNDLYFSQIVNWVIRRVKWVDNVAPMGGRGTACSVFVGQPEGKRPLGRTKHGWEVNTKMDLKEIGFECVDWIDMAQNKDKSQAVVNMVMYLHAPQAGNFLTSCGTSSFSKRTLLCGISYVIDFKLLV